MSAQGGGAGGGQRSKRVDEIVAEFDGRVDVVSTGTARRELAEALARCEEWADELKGRLAAREAGGGGG